MATPPSPPAAPRARDWGPALVLTIFLVAAVLVFAAVYFAYPAAHHLWSLLIIGILSLFFAIFAYLGQSLSSDPWAQQAVGWGFLALGFALLIGSLALSGPYVGAVDMFLGLALVVALAAVTAALILWRTRSVKSDLPREAKREAWRETTPVSAFDYGTARTNLPPSPPSSGGGPPPPPTGGS